MELEPSKAIATHQNFVKHAKKCKKSLDACDTCKLSVEYHTGLSLPLLSVVLADRSQAVRATFPD
jgi:hypothetical protein